MRERVTESEGARERENDCEQERWREIARESAGARERKIERAQEQKEIDRESAGERENDCEQDRWREIESGSERERDRERERWNRGTLPLCVSGGAAPLRTLTHSLSLSHTHTHTHTLVWTPPALSLWAACGGALVHGSPPPPSLIGSTHGHPSILQVRGVCVCVCVCVCLCVCVCVCLWVCVCTTALSRLTLDRLWGVLAFIFLKHPSGPKNMTANNLFK